MDDTEYLLSSAEKAKRLKKSVKEREESLMDDFFGIWTDKNQDVDADMSDIRQGRGIANELD